MPDNTPHEPSDKTRAEVAALVSFGNTQEDIARYIGVHVNTLIKYYRDELDNSVLQANAKVASRLFRKCVDDGDVPSMIFWLKTRARWRTTDNEETKKLESVVEKLLLKGLES